MALREVPLLHFGLSLFFPRFCLLFAPTQYNVHAFHAALAILRAFEKREEFDNVVKEVPRELRFATPSGRSISYDAEGEEMCAMPVCVRHVRLIQDLGRKHRRKSSLAPADSSAALREVEGSTAEVARSEQPEPLSEHSTAGVARSEQPELHDVGTTLNLAPHAQSDEDQYELLSEPPLSVERDRLNSSPWRHAYGSEWCENLAVEGAKEVSMAVEVKEWPLARPCSSSSHWTSTPLPENRLGSVLPNASAVDDSVAADLADPTATHSAGAGKEGESGRRLPPESTALQTFAQLVNAGGSGVGGEGTLIRSAAVEGRRVPPLLAASREEHLPPPQHQQQQRRGEGAEVDTGKGSSSADDDFGFVGDTRQPWRGRRGGEKGRLGGDGDSGDRDNDIDRCRDITGRRDGNFASNSLPRQSMLRAAWTTNTSELGGSSNEGLATEMNPRSGGIHPPTPASTQQAAAPSQQAPQARIIPGGLLTKRLWGSGMPLLHAKEKGEVSSTNAARDGERSSWPWSQTQSGTNNATKRSSPTEPSIASGFPVPSGSTRDVVREVASVAAAALPSLVTTMRNAREESRTGPSPPVFSAGAATISSGSHQVGREGEELCREDAGAGDPRAVGERRGVGGSGSAVDVAVGADEDEDDILNLWDMMGDGDASG